MGVAIGIAIQTARKRRGMTALQVADQVGMYRAVYTRVEQGWHVPTLTMLCQIAVVVKLDVDSLGALIDAMER